VEDYAGLIFLALPLLLLWLVVSRTRRQQRTLAAAQSSVQPGLWVMTTSGLHGKVVEADDVDAAQPTVLIEIAPGVHTRWARLAVAEVFEDDPVTRAARASQPSPSADTSTETPPDSSTETPAEPGAPAAPAVPAEPDDRTLT
jgi:preprotein translocase subunit YajC